MAFPEHINGVLDRFGIQPATKARLYDLYLELGSEVLEVLSDFADRFASPADIEPDDLRGIRFAVIERFVRKHHGRWLAGDPTPSLYHPRVMEGRASGMAIPRGVIDADAGVLDSLYDEELPRLVGEGQPLPRGILVLGRNAHFGGRSDTFSFDIIPDRLEEALDVAHAAGRQHTMPGSVGETSGSIDAGRRLALIWEIQPNVLKPSGEMNAAISKTYRRHRNWHVATLYSAIRWLQSIESEIFVLRGEHLATTHQVNPDKPVSETISQLHNRTVERVVEFLGGNLVPVDPADVTRLLESEVMNFALREFVEESGAAAAIWKLYLSPPE